MPCVLSAPGVTYYKQPTCPHIIVAIDTLSNVLMFMEAKTIHLIACIWHIHVHVSRGVDKPHAMVSRQLLS